MIRLSLASFFLLFSFQTLIAQFSDDFSDGNLDMNPPWRGDISDFIIENGELKLNASGAGSSVLYNDYPLSDSMAWEIYLRLEFAPSASNRLRIYLLADDHDFSSANGYFIEIGENGSNDAIRIFRQDAGVPVLIGKGDDGTVGGDPVEVRIQVSKMDTWKVAADYSGGYSFQTLAEFADDIYSPQSCFFGLQCDYTATRTDKFFFDDVSAVPYKPDLSPPKLLLVKAVTSSEILVNFSEPLDTLSALDFMNFFINGGIGNPGEVSWASSDATRLQLRLSNSLQSQQQYTLYVEGVEDRFGNALDTDSAFFTFLDVNSAAIYDILINEIMADPSPAIGLPDAEYVELYNRSDRIISLAGLYLADASARQPLPDSLLFPGEYLIICDDSQVSEFLPFGKIAALTSFPQLTNSGEQLSLETEDKEIIHSVIYDDSWYMDAGKANGGWSLELINPLTPCEVASNWTSSAHLSGGTPGRRNSVLMEEEDKILPALIGAFPDSVDRLVLTFSEGLEKSSALDPGNYVISPALPVEEIILISPLFNQVVLNLGESMEPGVIYVVKVKNGLKDCSGNSPGLDDSRNFALPLDMEKGDVVINEILFNPEPGRVDFIELYNSSGKILEISQLEIANFQPDNSDVEPIVENRLFFPGEFLVLTSNPEDILSRYQVPKPENIIRTNLPGFSDDEGNVTIYKAGLLAPVVIDAVDYSEDWHSELLDDAEGVSLERIDPHSHSQSSENWHSAAATAGFATPTGPNSQSHPINDSFEKSFYLEKAVFSPDGDGHEDFLLINYKMDNPGYVLNMKIFDTAGRLINPLYNGELLGVEGFIKWEGTTTSGRKAATGIYIIYFQLFSPEGDEQVFKKTCVVAANLE